MIFHDFSELYIFFTFCSYLDLIGYHFYCSAKNFYLRWPIGPKMYNAPRFVQFPRQNPCTKKFPKKFYLRRASGREISQISLMRRIFCTFLENGRKQFLSALGRNLGKYFYLRRGFCCLERLGKNSKISICTQKKNISICESATVYIGDYIGTTIGLIKGDTRSLDYSSSEPKGPLTLPGSL